MGGFRFRAADAASAGRMHPALTLGRLLLALTAALGTACRDNAPLPVASAADAAPRDGGTLVIAGPNDVGPMNAFIASESYTQDLLLHALFLPLVSLDVEGGFQPALARSWDWQGDTALVFHMRDDVRWSDGPKTTAWDVAFTFDRARDPASGFPNADDLMHWKSVSVVDSFTVRFTLDRFIDPLLTWAFLPIMPKHALDSIPPARMRQAGFNHAPIGNGPFRFAEYRAGDRWVFDANPDFPAGLGGRPHLDRVVWRVISENTAQVTELLTGNADLILAPRAEDLTRLRGEAGVVPIVKAATQYHFIGWNGKRRPLDDARVRRALTLSINRPQILQVLRGGHGELASGPIGPFHWAFPDSVRPLPYDTAAARALFAEAGLRPDASGKLRLPDGRPFRIELKIPTSNAFTRDVAEMIQADLANVGVSMSVRPVEFTTLIGQISSPARDFDAVLMAWDADFRINLRDTFHSAAINGEYQLASFHNATVDATLDTLATLTDRRDAIPRWHRVQRIIRDEQPWTFLWYVPNLYAARARLRGAVMDVRGAFINVGSWWLADAQPRTASR